MKESTFNTDIKNNLIEMGFWCYKIADSPSSWTASRTRFTVEKPCDIIASYRGKSILIEGKQLKEFKAFGLNMLRPSQIENMDDMVLGNKEKGILPGGRAFVFLNIRIKAVKGQVKQENRLIILDWKEWGPKLKAASIKKPELIAFPFIPGRKVDVGSSAKETRYDLMEFVKLL